jgi:hypothetical protein
MLLGSSFPRKRESIDPRRTAPKWIPAFAGMTIKEKAKQKHMLPTMCDFPDKTPWGRK